MPSQSFTRSELLLGALLVFPGALEAVAELVQPDVFELRQRYAFLGLVSLRAVVEPEDRLTALAYWLRARRMSALDLQRPLEAIADAPQLELEGVVELAREMAQVSA